MDNQYNNLLDLLRAYGNAPVAASVQDQVHQQLQSAPPSALGQGLTAAFNADHTPPFGQMVAHLFGQSDSEQKTGIINRLLSVLGPKELAMLSQMGVSQDPGTGMYQVDHLTQEQVDQIATHAHKSLPEVVQSMGAFYSHYPALLKTLGAAALSIVLAQIHKHAD